MFQPKERDWLNRYKLRPAQMLSTRDPLQNQGHYRMKVRVWKKVLHANESQKKAGEAILISEKRF